MGDPWQDEGFAGENDWDEGEESLATDLEQGFDDPDDVDDELVEDSEYDQTDDDEDEG